jgi:phenylacetate-CoA ligase
MPVVRYRTRDLTRLLPGTARPGMRRMEKVTGRSDDLMIVRGVNVFPTQVEELVLSIEGLTPYFQCVLERPHRLDELTILVEAAPSVRDRRWPELGDALAGLVKRRIGVSAGVRVVEPGGIERSLGKARRIVDNRPRA